MNRGKSIARICFAGGILNLILFFVKLYVGLSANSVSIFSDSMNNLADSISCMIGVACMAASVRLAEKGVAYVCGKVERLLSFLLSLVVAAVGAGFAYSSLERFMYPTPVWFTAKYFAVVSLTAAVKLAMFFIYRNQAKKNASPVLRILQTDSIMDFCVTGITLVSFVMTKYSDFSIDAFGGLAISAFIIVGAARLVKSDLYGVIDYVPEKTRSAVQNAVSQFFENGAQNIVYSVQSDGTVTAYITLSGEKTFSAENPNETVEALKLACREAGVNAKVII